MSRFLSGTVRVLVVLHAVAVSLMVFFFAAFAAGLVAGDREATAVLLAYVAAGVVYVATCVVAAVARDPRVHLGAAALVALATVVGARVVGGPGAGLPGGLPELAPSVLLLVLAVAGLARVADESRGRRAVTA